jgi:hypothetical protein
VPVVRAEPLSGREQLNRFEIGGVQDADRRERVPGVERVEPVLHRIDGAHERDPLARLDVLTHLEPSPVEDLEADAVEQRSRRSHLDTGHDQLRVVAPVTQPDRVQPQRQVGIGGAAQNSGDHEPVLRDERRVVPQRVFPTECFAHHAHADTMNQGCVTDRGARTDPR